MPAETRIFRKTTQTINGLSAYILGLTGDAAPALRIDTTGYTQAGIRVWKRDEAGTETEITAGSPVAVVTIPSVAGTLTATWDCPQTPLASTDAIVVRLYFYSTSWVLQRTWITEQLGASQLDAATWTVYHRFILVIGVIYWTHGPADYSRIGNFSWTAPPPPAVGYSYSDGLACIQVG
jgi:hypothetical protein